MRTRDQKIMQSRLTIVSMLLAGATALASPVSAEPVAVHHAAPHPVAVGHPHAVFHAPRPGFRPGWRPGLAHGVAGFRGAGFHPLHAALIGHVGFAHFTPAQRAVWTHGRWYHQWWHGRYGWWWYAGGAWFWYTAPVYPYPTAVSDYYYEEPQYNEPGPTAYYCYNPAGYYPYVPNCYGPWRPVPTQGYGYDQSGPDQGPPGGYDQGPPPGYDQGPPQGYDQGPPPGYDQGPPSGYDQGPPPGYNDQGPPPGGQGAPDNQQGPQ
jgi:hypothetical protein